ncbi:MAG: hypothetical protein KGL10_06530 [Alphaproteobacteria bacterium]|nr:hypothetical protein [Alphaproteobacteria bacterium]MDE2336948.1 hypothetical protein [Alphaproteobacteria bacterium]
MKQKALSDIFNMVSSTRRRKWFIARFTPLAVSDAVRLNGLVKEALKSPQEPADAAVRNALKKSDRLFKKYENMPETTLQLAETIPFGFPYSADAGDRIISMGDVSMVYRNLPNPERPKTLKKIQSGLYKALKRHAPQ